MASNNVKIRGITIELGADTTQVTQSFKELRSSLSKTQSALNDVQKVLKLDPSNTELLKQRQEYLAKAIEDTSKKLEEEKKMLQQLQDADNADQTIEQQRALQRDIVATTDKLKDLKKEAKDAASVLGH